MGNWLERFKQGLQDAEDLDNEAMEALKALLPTGNIFQPRKFNRGWERPQGSGVYAIWNPGEPRPLWVGYSAEFWQRSSGHRTAKRYRPGKNFMTLYQCEDEDRARDIESLMISLLRPTQNKVAPFRRVVTDRLTEFAISLGITVE